MSTSIIYNNVNKCYALQKGQTVHWTKDPAEATTWTELLIQGPFRSLEIMQGPALDGSLEIKDQIAEVKRLQAGRYHDSDEYEDGDDTDTA